MNLDVFIWCRAMWSIHLEKRSWLRPITIENKYQILYPSTLSTTQSVENFVCRDKESIESIYLAILECLGWTLLMGEKARDGNSNHMYEYSIYSFSQPTRLTNFTKVPGNLKHSINSAMAIKAFFSPFTHSLWVCPREQSWLGYYVSLWFSRTLEGEVML